jgi:hypothetical protein
VLAIRAAAPEVYNQALRLPSGDRRLGIVLLTALASFIVLLGIGVLRRWRWTLWLIMVAFLAGVSRVPAVILQLTAWGAEIRSCSSPVLMKKPAEQVTPLYPTPASFISAWGAQIQPAACECRRRWSV